MSPKTRSTVKTKKIDDDLGLELTDVADVVNHRSTVLYGRSGSGKTTLASTWPKPILYANIRDNGTDSIADVPGVKVFNVHDLDDIEDLRMAMIANKKKKLFKTLVIDTVSQLQELYVEAVAAKKAKKKDKKAGEWGSMTKQDWGAVSSEMKALIIELRDLPMEVVFIAQDKTFNFDDENGESDGQLMPEVGPRLMPSVATVMNAAVHVIGCTFIQRKTITKKDPKNPTKKIKRDKTVYCLRLAPSPVFVTKVRKPRDVEAPEYIEDPTYDDLVAVIEGDY